VRGALLGGMRIPRDRESVHGRGEGGGRLEIDRKADRAALDFFVVESEVDAEREDLRVEAEAAHRGAGEQLKRPGARADARTVGGRGLEVPAGGARVRDRRIGATASAPRSAGPLTYRSRKVLVTVTKKSHATMARAGFFRNVDQRWSPRGRPTGGFGFAPRLFH